MKTKMMFLVVLVILASVFLVACDLDGMKSPDTQDKGYAIGGTAELPDETIQDLGELHDKTMETQAAK